MNEQSFDSLCGRTSVVMEVHRIEGETMDITNLLVQLVSGAVGGNAAGAILKKSSLGAVGNSVAGILGGTLGSQILAALGSGAMQGAESSMAIESIASNIAGGGVGGAILIAIIGAVRKSMAAKASS